MGFFTTAAYTYWQFWEEYDPSNGTFGTQKVAWDGNNKIIYIVEGVRSIDVKVDIYSAYKEWILGAVDEFPPMGYEEAISAIGGEPLNDTLNVGTTFFLENGWRIQPAPSSQPYVLTVDGNLYTREAGGNPFLFAEGVSVNLTRSNLVDQVVATSTIRGSDREAIAADVWGYALSEPTGSLTYGQLVKDIDSDLSDVNTEVRKTLTKGEFLALK